TGQPDAAWSPRWSPDGRYVLWPKLPANAPAEILQLTRVEDGHTEHLRGPLLGGGKQLAPATFSDAQHVVYCAEEAGIASIRERSLETGREITIASFDDRPAGCAFSRAAAGRVLVTVRYLQPAVGVFDLAARFPKLRLLPDVAEMYPIAIAPRDRGVVTCCRDGKFVEFSLATGSPSDLVPCKGASWIIRVGDELLHIAVHEEATHLHTVALRPPSCEPVEEWLVPKVGAATGIPSCTASRCVLLVADAEQFWIFRKDKGDKGGLQIPVAHVMAPAV